MAYEYIIFIRTCYVLYVNLYVSYEDFNIIIFVFMYTSSKCKNKIKKKEKMNLCIYEYVERQLFSRLNNM